VALNIVSAQGEEERRRCCTVVPTASHPHGAHQVQQCGLTRSTGLQRAQPERSGRLVANHHHSVDIVRCRTGQHGTGAGQRLSPHQRTPPRAPPPARARPRPSAVALSGGGPNPAPVPVPRVGQKSAVRVEGRRVTRHAHVRMHATGHARTPPAAPAGRPAAADRRPAGLPATGNNFCGAVRLCLITS